MKFPSSILAAAALTAASMSPALASEQLAQQKACLACHGVDKPSLGPSFKAVAAKYRGQKGMDAKLAQKIVKGGGGVWNMPMGAMPPQAQVKDAEALQLARWILALK